MNGAKIQFSGAEMDLINNANIILTKNEALEKIKLVLLEAQKQMQQVQTADGLFLLPPKISRGENYLGLPYLVLDYPRRFSANDIAMIRSMFWWGNFFSSTLVLSGQTKANNVKTLQKGYLLFAEKGYYVGVSDDAWQHHFEQDNYCLISSLSNLEFSDICNRFHHIKIALKWPLQIAPLAANYMAESWYFFMRLLGVNYPLNDEKDLLPENPKGGFDL